MISLTCSYLSTFHILSWCRVLVKGMAIGSIIYSATSIWWNTLLMGGVWLIILVVYGKLIKNLIRRMNEV